MHLAHSVHDRGRNEVLLFRSAELHNVPHYKIPKAISAQAKNILQQLSDERAQLVRATVLDQSLHDTTSILMPGSEERPFLMLHDHQ